MLKADVLKGMYEAGLDYGEYVASGKAEHQKRWAEVYEAVTLTEEQKKLLGSFRRQMYVLVSSGTWCGDCVLQGPMVAKIGEASEKVGVRFVDRDQFGELRDTVKVCGGTRVPMAVLMAEDFEFCGLYGDRSLSRYRAMAQQRLGSACSTGLFLPAEEEMAATLADWVNEVERVQLMLRLSTRLREKYQD